MCHRTYFLILFVCLLSAISNIVQYQVSSNKGRIHGRQKESHKKASLLQISLIRRSPKKKTLTANVTCLDNDGQRPKDLSAKLYFFFYRRQTQILSFALMPLFTQEIFPQICSAYFLGSQLLKFCFFFTTVRGVYESF